MAIQNFGTREQVGRAAPAFLKVAAGQPSLQGLEIFQIVVRIRGSIDWLREYGDYARVAALYETKLLTLPKFIASVAAESC